MRAPKDDKKGVAFTAFGVFVIIILTLSSSLTYLGVRVEMQEDSETSSLAVKNSAHDAQHVKYSFMFQAGDGNEDEDLSWTPPTSSKLMKSKNVTTYKVARVEGEGGQENSRRRSADNTSIDTLGGPEMPLETNVLPPDVKKVEVDFEKIKSLRHRLKGLSRECWELKDSQMHRSVEEHVFSPNERQKDVKLKLTSTGRNAYECTDNVIVLPEGELSHPMLHFEKAERLPASFDNVRSNPLYETCGENGVKLLEDYARTALFTPILFDKLVSLSDKDFEQWMVDHVRTTNDIHFSPSARAEASRWEGKMRNVLTSTIPNDGKRFEAEVREQVNHWKTRHSQTVADVKDMLSKVENGDTDEATLERLEDMKAKATLLDGWTGKFEPRLYGPFSKQEALSLFPPQSTPAPEICSSLFNVPPPLLRPRETPKRVAWFSTYAMEEEMLELRLRMTRGVVDHHIIGESIFTMTGTLKPLFLYHLRKSNPKSAKLFDNVTHMIFGAATLPTRGFDMEFLSRSLMWCGMEKLVDGLKDDDIIMYTDMDELIDPSIIACAKHYDGLPEYVAIAMRWTYFGFFWENSRPTTVATMLSYRGLREMQLDVRAIRENPNRGSMTYSRSLATVGSMQNYGGWHCSWCSRLGSFRQKLNYALHGDGLRWGDFKWAKSREYLEYARRRGVWFDQSVGGALVDPYTKKNSAPPPVFYLGKKFAHLLDPYVASEWDTWKGELGLSDWDDAGIYRDGASDFRFHHHPHAAGVHLYDD